MSDKIKATVIATGEEIEVEDYGPKMHPRYWGETQGYSANELKFEEVPA